MAAVGSASTAATAGATPAASATLPRRWGGSNRIVVHNKGEFKLRRNGSLADMSASVAAVSQQPLPMVGAAAGGGSSRPQLQRPAVAAPAGKDDMLRAVHVPAHVVKSIVISVLQQQGVPNPSEEILHAAIQEYYAKNPQGVSF